MVDATGGNGHDGLEVQFEAIVAEALRDLVPPGDTGIHQLPRPVIEGKEM